MGHFKGPEFNNFKLSYRKKLNKLWLIDKNYEVNPELNLNTLRQPYLSSQTSPKPDPKHHFYLVMNNKNWLF